MDRILLKFVLQNDQGKFVTRLNQNAGLTVTSNRELAYVFNNEDENILDVQAHCEKQLEQELTPIDWQTGNILDETDEDAEFDDYSRSYGPQASYWRNKARERGEY